MKIEILKKIWLLEFFFSTYLKDDDVSVAAALPQTADRPLVDDLSFLSIQFKTVLIYFIIYIYLESKSIIIKHCE